MPESPYPPERLTEGPSLVLVGTDYRHAPLEIRERVAFGKEDTSDALVHLLARPEIGEACLLSTCNRTEVYVRPCDEQLALRSVVEHIFEARAPQVESQGRLYVKWHGEAASHLLSVASGLESMVLGEPEILGQVHQSAAAAEAVGATGEVLKRLLRAAFNAGRRARAETGIATGAVSFGYSAVELARNIFSNLETTKVLLVGAGDIARQVARNLVERGAKNLTVTNRSLERAESFAAEVGNVQVLPFDSRVEALREVDLVVVSTAAEEPVLTREQMRRGLARRKPRALLLVDLSVPRNIEPKAGTLDNVFLHDIDSLDHLIQRNLKRRREAVPRVEEIIEEELGHFREAYRGRKAEPLVAQLQRQAETIRAQEVEAAMARFPEDTHDHLHRLTRALVRKLLHHPSTRLRREQQEESHLAMVRELFKLDPED